MTGEIIEVCQDCGHVIDPEIVSAPWGQRYRIMVCQRDECFAERIAGSFRFDEPPGRSAYPLHIRWLAVPTTVDPASLFRITGY